MVVTARVKASAALLLCGAAAYANSFRVPFLFDDPLSTVDNPTLRRWATVFCPPHGQGITVEGRPILNASLALNWAVSGPAVWSYHLLNLLIHLGSALLLFALIARTLPLLAAFAAALLWTVHPVQTESVTYIVQRAESLMGLFYLLTRYCFVRFADLTSSDGPGSGTPGGVPLPNPSIRWGWLSVVCCLLGMASKEVMVSAPLVVLLYDRTFLSGTFGAALRRHGKVHAALWCSLLLLALLIYGSGSRGGTVGFHAGVGVWPYLQSQCHSLVRYLRLSFWPSPLIFDYGTQWFSGWAVVPSGLLLLLLLGLTLAGLPRRRWPRAAFLGVAFFLILAPTSSIVPGNRQTSAEHRMYLPLACVIVLAVAGIVRAAGRRERGAALALCLLAVPLGAATVRRNRDYRSAEALYRDVEAKLPSNAFVHYNLGKLLDESGRPAAGVAEYQQAIAGDPRMMYAYFNLGNAFSELGRPRDAEAAFRRALDLNPNYAQARYNLGNTLLQQGRKAEAAEQFNDAVQIDPAYVDARDNLGAVLLSLGRVPEAERQFLAVLQLHPSPETYYGLGRIYRAQGRLPEARRAFAAALGLDPTFTPARQQLEDLFP